MGLGLEDSTTSTMMGCAIASAARLRPAPWAPMSSVLVRVRVGVVRVTVRVALTRAPVVRPLNPLALTSSRRAAAVRVALTLTLVVRPLLVNP